MGSASKSTIRECTNCGDEIRAYAHRKKLDEIFCSLECQSDFKNVDRNCVHCGEEFSILKSDLKNGRDGTGRYCSAECMDEWRSENWVGEENPLYTKKEIQCTQCGTSYREKPAKMEMYEMHFCSRSCHGDWNSENLTGENHPRWVDDRSTQSFYDEPEWKEVRKVVWKRDEHTCQACSETNLLIHAHHIEPLPDGPKFALDNLITLCVGCHNKVHAGVIDCPEIS